jgi:hypothetical protein
MARVDKFFDKFFEEKQINFQSWELQDEKGTTHFIDSDVVIEAIRNCTLDEKLKIEAQLRLIDFKNKPVEPFLKYLAQGLVNMYAG